VSNLRYTVEETSGIWLQLWWHDEERVLSDDLKAQSLAEAELVAHNSSPLKKVMESLGRENRQCGGSNQG
jgi:hypothetical protein